MENFLEWKNQIVSYLLKSHIGHLFKDGSIQKENITKMELFGGKGVLRCLELDEEFLNEIGDQLNFPLTVVRGHLEQLSFEAPWWEIPSGGLNVSLDFHGLFLVLEPKEDIDDAASMWSSAIGRLVEKSHTYKNKGETPVLMSEGAKKVDDFFRYIMSKVNIVFKDTVICLQPRNSDLGIKLNIKLESIRFYGEDIPLKKNEPTKKVPEKEHEQKRRGTGPEDNSSYSKKSVEIIGVSFWITDIPAERTEYDSKRQQKTDGSAAAENEIIFALLGGQQVISNYVKSSSDENGPGLKIEAKLGDFIVFLTPKQVYLLAEFMQEYCKTDDDRLKRGKNNKPMGASDFQRLEGILQQQMYQINTPMTGIQPGYGWSGELSDINEEQFYSMTGPDSDDESEMTFMTRNFEHYGLNTSAHSIDYSERASTVAYSRSIASHCSRPASLVSTPQKKPTYDPGQDMFTVNLVCSGLQGVLLHDDILNVNEKGNAYTLDSVIKLQEKAMNFLKEISKIPMTELVKYNKEEVKRIFDGVCMASNIRLLSAGVDVRCKIEPQKNTFDATITLKRFSLSECLFDYDKLSIEVPLVVFDKSLEECVKISLNTVKQYRQKSEFVVKLEECTIEADITITDRISALLNLPLFSKTKESSQTMQQKKKTTFALDMSKVKFLLRFPIPDFTAAHLSTRVPWWKRNVRMDYMTLEFTDLFISTTISSSKKTQSEYKIKFDVLDLYYHDETATPIYFGQIGDTDQKFDDCKVIIKFVPNARVFYIKEEEDEATQSAFSVDLLDIRDNGPFTNKLVIHHSKVDHLDEQFKESTDILIPGDLDELHEFKSTSISSSKLVVDVELSSVKIQITSKLVYEKIYNRISNDLLLWQPTRLNAKKAEDVFQACRGTAGNDDDDDEDVSDSEQLFHSSMDGDEPKEQEKQETTFVKKCIGQSTLVVDVKILNGTICLNPPARHSDMGNVLPERLGYFALDVSRANIFLVTGYKGSSALDYLCIDVDSCDMKHKEMVNAISVVSCLPDLDVIPVNLFPVISKSMGALAEERPSQTQRPMLTVACKIISEHDTRHAKTVKIALGVYKSTLHYRTVPEPNSWVSQLIDFFTVIDIPIVGYKPKEVLSEFHIHTWDCAIEYRPLFFPLRCALTLGSFNMTSNVNEGRGGSKLRFLAEDCDLYISQEHPPESGVASTVPINIRKEYINVVNMNSFELSLTTNDRKCRTHPRTDLKVSTDYLKIHTCFDSLKALTDLISYVASDGDLSSNEPSQPSSSHHTPRHWPGDQQLIPVDPFAEAGGLTEEEQREIHFRVDEAMKESIIVEKESEEAAKRKRDNLKHFPQVQTDLGDLDATDEELEDSFIIIDEDHGDEMFPKYITPEFIWTVDLDTYQINHEYLQPGERRDKLETPTKFPLPIAKYTLCELNIIWQLYGGKDFRKIEKKKRTSHVPSSHRGTPVSHFSSNDSIYSRCSSSVSTHRERTDSEKDWKTAGGEDRNKNELMEVVLNKVRCQFDIFPLNTKEAQRFVLQIKDFEIIDKMKTSDINKFMCQYTSESLPKKTQSYMFSIEAIKTRNVEFPSETETSLNISMLPLRFYIDQESLEFLMKFFAQVAQKSEYELNTTPRQTTPVHHPPPRLFLGGKKETKLVLSEDVDNDNEDLIDLDDSQSEDGDDPVDITMGMNTFSQPLYFRPVTFYPETFVKIDYQGKNFAGALDGSVKGVLCSLILGLASLDNTEIKLKKLCNRYGIDGFENVLNFILEQWLDDIKKNQLQNVLIGVGPMQALVQLFGGVRDLFWCPIEQYQKDGRIIKGLRKGANKFSTSTALAALDLTFKFIQMVQLTAETAYDIMSPGPSMRQLSNEKKRKRRYKQPRDIREGVTNAYFMIKEGFTDTAVEFVQTANQEHKEKGVIGYVGTITRNVPHNIIKPIIIASEATNNVLGGIKAQLVPDARLEATQKWKKTYE